MTNRNNTAVIAESDREDVEETIYLMSDPEFMDDVREAQQGGSFMVQYDDIEALRQRAAEDLRCRTHKNTVVTRRSRFFLASCY